MSLRIGSCRLGCPRPNVRVCRGLPVLWAVLAAAAAAAPAPASLPPGDADPAAGLAALDSLLTCGADAEAEARGRALASRWGQDPLYGWQIDGRLGLALLRTGRAGEALPCLERAAAANPRDASLHRNLGAALRALGRKGRALSEYRSAAELAPREWQVRLEYGQFLLEFGDLAGARQNLSAADELCGRCPQARQGLANLYLAQGDDASAAPLLQELYRQDPAPQVRRLLALALLRSGRAPEAAGLLRAVPRSDLLPDEHRLIVQAEAALPDSGAAASADYAAEAGCAAGGLPLEIRQDASFWGLVATNLLAAGRWEAGLPAAERSVRLDPRDAVLRNNLAALLAKVGRTAEAATQRDSALALDPNLGAKETP